MVQPSFQNLMYYFQRFGVLDVLLPFILVFTLIYAAANMVPLLQDSGDTKNKNLRIVVALVFGLLFVGPHILGTYPLGYDPVVVLNQALPSVSLVAIAAVMILLLLGIFGRDLGRSLQPFIAVVSIGFVVYIFGASLNLWRGPYDIFYWWTTEVTELLLIIAVFGLIVWFITKEPDTTSTDAEKKAKAKESFWHNMLKRNDDDWQ